MNKVKGHIATVYHAGSNSYYEATLIRKVSRAELIAVDKAASGEDPRPDGAIFQEVLRAALDPAKTKWEYYNDLAPSKETRRLKAAWLFPTPAQLKKLEVEAHRQFGDRVLKVGVTREIKKPFSRYSTSGGEFYVKLSAY